MAPPIFGRGRRSFRSCSGGCGYDRANFDVLPIEYGLGRIANRRNAAEARLAVTNLLAKVWIIGELEGEAEMRFEFIGSPNVLHTGVAKADHPGELARGPMSHAWRFFVQLHVALNHRGAQRRLASRSGRLPLEPRNALRATVIPAIGGPLGFPRRFKDPVTPACAPHIRTIRARQANF